MDNEESSWEKKDNMGSVFGVRELAVLLSFFPFI